MATTPRQPPPSDDYGILGFDLSLKVIATAKPAAMVSNCPHPALIVLGPGGFIVAIPTTSFCNDPSQPGKRMRRMGVFLTFCVALQRRADGFGHGHRQQGGINHVGCRSGTAVARIDQLDGSARRRQADQANLNSRSA